MLIVGASIIAASALQEPGLQAVGVEGVVAEGDDTDVGLLGGLVMLLDTVKR